MTVGHNPHTIASYKALIRKATSVIVGLNFIAPLHIWAHVKKYAKRSSSAVGLELHRFCFCFTNATYVANWHIYRVNQVSTFN